MINVLTFLEELSSNNNRIWFESNKQRYVEIRKQFDFFAEKLITGISGFDSSVRGLSVKDCTYRINRDTRFSANKDPYKTYMGVFVCPKGKKSGYAGYYFQLEPNNISQYGNILASGAHCPIPGVLRSVREDILVNGDQFISSVVKADGFHLDANRNNKIKRMPLGFPANSEYSDYIKFKEFVIYQDIPNNIISSDDFIDFCITQFSKTKSFNSFLNRSIDYYFENEIS